MVGQISNEEVVSLAVDIEAALHKHKNPAGTATDVCCFGGMQPCELSVPDDSAV